MLRFEPTWEELELYKDGGVAIIDQWICSHARCSGRGRVLRTGQDRPSPVPALVAAPCLLHRKNTGSKMEIKSGVECFPSVVGVLRPLGGCACSAFTGRHARLSLGLRVLEDRPRDALLRGERPFSSAEQVELGGGLCPRRDGGGWG